MDKSIGKIESKEDEAVDCPETKVCLWEDDEFNEYEVDYLNQIYPFELNKDSLTPTSQFLFHFLNSSLHYWVELKHTEPKLENKLGTTDSKFISEMLKGNDCENSIVFQRWGKYFNKSEHFFKHMEEEPRYQPPKGEDIHHYTRNGERYVIVRYYGTDTEFIKYRERLEILLLFYIDGVSFIREVVDEWVFYLIFKIKQSKELIANQEHESSMKDSPRIFVGMLSQFIFKLSANKQRDRVSQVFITPPFQRYGHGKELLDLVYGISLKNKNCFEITTEIPSTEYQCLRDYKEMELLLEIVPDTLKLPFNEVKTNLMKQVRRIKENIKIPGHQIERLANIITYYMIQKDEMEMARFEENLRQQIIRNSSPFQSRKKQPYLVIYGQVPDIKDFLLEKNKEEMLRNVQEIQENLTETLSEYRNVIKKMIKNKIIQ